MSYTEELHIEMFCSPSDRGTLEQLGFVADSEFRVGDAVRMTRAGNRPLIATLIGLGEEGIVMFAYVTGAKHHPPAALAGDGAKLSFVPCDHETRNPVVRVTRDGRVVGIDQAVEYWATATAAMAKLGLKFAENNQDRRIA